MEFLIGSMLTLVSVIVIQKSTKTYQRKYKAIPPRFTQSRSYEVTKIFSMIVPEQKEMLDTQATNHFDSQSTTVLLFENNAYWILDNKVYIANIVDGQIDEESKKVVDTINMSDVELKKIVFVVETLTKGGDNDRRSSGK